MANLTRKENLGRTIRQQRNDRRQPPNPEIRAKIPVLLLEYQLSENGGQFLLIDCGHGNEDRILMFGTHQAAQLLANSGEWYCDRTFSVCPHIFFQLYTIHARINSKTIPFIFGLMPSKRRITYNRFFSEIQNHVLAAGNKPNTILCDSELAAINSASATSEIRTLVVLSFIYVQTSLKRFNHLACRYSIIMIKSFLFIHE